MKTITFFAIGLLFGITHSGFAQRIVVASGLAAYPANPPAPATAAPPAVAPAAAAPSPVTIILPQAPAQCAPACSAGVPFAGNVFYPPAIYSRPANVVYFGGYSSQSYLPPGYPGYSGRYPYSSVVYFGRGESFRQGYYFNRDR